MTIGCLIDLTRCIGCRSCQAACKQANRMPAEKTRLAGVGGYQNPPRLSAKTRTLISFHEFDAAEGPAWVFMKHQCLHCNDARCATVCAPQAFSRTPEGIVICDSSKCVACAACIDECPYGVPALEFLDLDTPRLVKCDWCAERRRDEGQGARGEGQGARDEGQGARDEGQGAREKWQVSPACARACPTGAIEFGQRDELLKAAKRRIAASPGKYIDHVYGEKELDGTGWMYLSHVPFEKLGLPLDFPPAAGPRMMGRAAPPTSPPPASVTALGAAALGLAWFCRRRDDVTQSEQPDASGP